MVMAICLCWLSRLVRRHRICYTVLWCNYRGGLAAKLKFYSHYNTNTVQYNYVRQMFIMLIIMTHVNMIIIQQMKVLSSSDCPSKPCRNASMCLNMNAIFDERVVLLRQHETWSHSSSRSAFSSIMADCVVGYLLSDWSKIVDRRGWCFIARCLADDGHSKVQRATQLRNHI